MYIKSQVNLFDSTAFFSSHSNIINLTHDKDCDQYIISPPPSGNWSNNQHDRNDLRNGAAVAHYGPTWQLAYFHVRAQAPRP
ncbi:hypothetical protein EDI29_21980 [Pectobacterium polonicum]|nr:hypothetical protein EDI29_21980 [Pectobacterium polonicum]